MNYFVSENVFTFNSGTEHSQAKRVQMFNAMGDKAQYVTRNYNRFLARDTEAIGLMPADVINMYDYFQGTTNVPRTELPLRLLPQIPLDEYHIEGHGPNYSTINHVGRELARINVMPATVGLTNDINYFDRYENTTARENYDWRGFMSSVDYFHPNGQLAVQKFLNLDGEVVLEIMHMNINGELRPTMWKLLNYKGKNFRFNTEDQLFLFFLNELTQANPGSVVVSDRRSLDYVVADVAYAEKKFAYLHDIHTPQVDKPVKGKLYDAYRTVLETRGADFDGIFVPTAEQRDDLKQRFPTLNLHTAPDTFVKDTILNADHIALSDRVKGRIVYVGRLSPEKRPDQAIRALAKVVESVPEATLVFHGYPANQEILQQLKDLANQLNVSDKVTFGEYVTGDALADAYKEAQVIVQTSVGEGFGMNLVEAFGYGVPAVSYDITYGTKELVNDGVNGYVVPSGAHGTMGERIAQILSDDNQWATLSEGAYKKAQEFSAKKMYAAWADVM
jgi:poly(glycerol-phosphate) alpha-glucosyltransferase